MEDIYSEAWTSLLKLKKQTNYLVREAMAKEEKIIIDKIRGKGEEEGKDWYRFLKGGVRGEEKIDELIVDGQVINDKNNIKLEVEKFWKHLSGSEFNWEEGNLNFQSARKIIPNFDHEFSKQEIRNFIISLKNDKTAGFNEIPYEMLKQGESG